ncbi:MAG TPA: serine hydrolase, partial [Arenibacter sp.]|nr:serine hydrolase [Arenibacter sp.]
MKNTNAIITLLFLLLILAVPANGQTGSNTLSSVNISGIDKERLNRYDDFLKKEISEGRIPGAVSYIMRRGEIVHETAYGYSSLADKTPIRQD